MARSTPPLLHRQIARVGRRLFAQTLLNALAWCWAAALLLTLAWFLVQPLAFAAPEWLRWAVAGGALAVGAAAAVVFAVVRAPSRLAAALSLDEKFGLRERVTTSLTLTPEQEATSAGKALLEDVGHRVAKLDVGSRFPVQVRWHAALVPAAAALLAVVAVFYQPPAGPPPASAGENEPLAAVDRDKIEEAVKNREKKQPDKRPADEPRSDDLKKLEEELEKILNQPRDTKEQVRDQVKDLGSLEDKMKEMEERLAKKQQDKADALKKQMEQKERLAKKQKNEGKDSDADKSDLAKALERADLDKAADEIQKLAKKLKDEGDKLSKEDREKIQEQIKKLQDDLEQLTRDTEELEDDLKRLAREGKLDEEELRRELEELQKNRKQLEREMEEMRELIEELDKCEKCLEEGDCEGAAEALRRVAKKLGRLGDDADLKELAEQLEQLRACRRAMCQGLDGKKGGMPGGLRDSRDTETTSKEERVRNELSKGSLRVVGDAPGDGTRPKSPSQIQPGSTDFQQAVQQASEASERQRVPKAAADQVKGFFENLGGQKQPEKK